MIPELDDAALDAHRSRAEADVYRACRDRLPDDIVVVFDMHILHRGKRVHEGEADFVVLDPDRGILVLEVKGGGIGHDPATRTWTSRDRNRVVNTIDDPFLQASTNKHVLLDMVRRHPRGLRHRVVAGHAVLFPDLTRRDLAALHLSHTPPEIVGSGDDLATLAAWMVGVYAFSAAPGDRPLGQAGVDATVDLLGRKVEIEVPRSTRLRDQERERIVLTNQQAIVLESAADRPRVAISGGAGTGKTLLALLEAKRRAEAGGRPLLLCFNQLLAGYLRVAAAPGVATMSLHEFYTWWLSVVKTETDRNLVTEAEAQYPGSDHASVILPQAFTVALDEGFVPDFDSVIVDEGQDFGDSDWLAIDAWAEKKGVGMLVLFDPNQTLYKRSDCFPFTDADCLRLTRNCRHTTPIHHASYRRHYEGPIPRPSPIPGDAPVAIHAGNLGSQGREIRNLVQRLFDEGVPADDITVLVMALDTGTQACRAALPPLANSLAWGRGHRTGAVCVESVARYKGLDAAVIVLWLASEFDAKIHREWVYVGLSRAKSFLYVVGTNAMCKDVL